ncbi:hypothetical protein RO3G_11089 [Rhizopus delemar RA 99-880]|uniref:Uncharacterized protein n=1 Tax=Rhizopus delemar (strain RA 99-880 / ATCC MYA-4621 / FGSC 9543 / NRRL 43880) TaxID=246409 RepID=I1CD48_RHIO9|nr:hypothetical protein RO3G_11089 [Rhizopus delemar RA 99-880]|eukprot:EIE86378.1 hypothetical protein RO3G_11089 [Rhizopus delemar RA 99-880]
MTFFIDLFQSTWIINQELSELNINCSLRVRGRGSTVEQIPIINSTLTKKKRLSVTFERDLQDKKKETCKVAKKMMNL